MKRLLFYSHDSYGLGNVRRMLAIANYLVDRHEDISVLLISGSPMLHAFRIPRQIDYVKLPCLSRSRSGAYNARLESFRTKELLKLRSKLIKNVVTEFKPDLFLVDKKPEGLGGELRRTMKVLQRQEDPPRKLLLLRDILDSPKITRKIWQEHNYYRVLDKHYDEILVVGQQSVFDVTKKYAFPAPVARSTTFCGYLKRPPGQYSRNQIRNKLGLSRQQPLVLVAAGGGDDGKHVLSDYLHGIRENPLKDDGRSILFHGPEMRHSDYVELNQLASRCQNVELREFSNDIMSYLDAADLVIAMGGYNTVCEILSLNKQSIIIPRVTPVLEQYIRAKRFSELNLLDYIHPDDLTPARLMALVGRLLVLGKVPLATRIIDMEGMKNIEHRLLHHLALKAPREQEVAAKIFVDRRQSKAEMSVAEGN